MRFRPMSLLIVFLLLAAPARSLPLTPDQAAEMVAAHNRLRERVGVAALEWSAALGASAQRWAERLAAERGCAMEHSASRDVGENLFWQGARIWSDGRRERQPVSASEVVAAWGSEAQHYDHESNRCAAGKVCGHYTQIVWKNTRQVGCGAAACQDQSQIWVCHYAPVGNWVGERPY